MTDYVIKFKGYKSHIVPIKLQKCSYRIYTTILG